MSDLDRDALDAWITSPCYSESVDIGYCHNTACRLYGDEQEVDTYTEYGRTYWRRDECSACGKDLEEQPPENEQEGSDDG